MLWEAGEEEGYYLSFCSKKVFPLILRCFNYMSFNFFDFSTYSVTVHCCVLIVHIPNFQVLQPKLFVLFLCVCFFETGSNPGFKLATSVDVAELFLASYVFTQVLGLQVCATILFSNPDPNSSGERMSIAQKDT